MNAPEPRTSPLGARASRPLEQWWASGPLRAGRPRSQEATHNSTVFAKEFGTINSDTGQRPRPRIPKAPREAGLSVLLDGARAPYIIPSIPPMPPGGIAGPSSFFGFSATVASVVISSPAIDAAF